MSDHFDAFRLYASPRDLKKLRLWAAAFGGVALSTGWLHAPEVAIPAVGIAVTLLIISGLITVPEEECGFCRKTRIAVNLMVAGTSASICDECATLSTETFATTNEAKGDPAWLSDAIFALPSRCPRAISTPLFRACTPKDETQRERLIGKAFAVDNPEAVEELIRRSPDQGRTGRDWINLGVALERQGRFREAIEAAERVAGMPEHEPWLLNNRGSARLELEPCDEPTLRQLLADNLRGQELLEQSKAPGHEPVVASMLGSRAELHRRLGGRAQALQCLEQARALVGDRPSFLITQAELGPTEAARELLERALTLAHPESRDAEKARRLLGAVTT